MNSVRLMTTNLLYTKGATAQALHGLLDVVKPDILAVQELTPALSGYIYNKAPQPFRASRDDGSAAALGRRWFSRRKPSEQAV